MRCDQSERWISMGADQELSVQEVRLLREHLAQCAPCQALSDEATDMRGWFVTAPQEPIPAGFSERVVAAAFDGQPQVAKGPQGLVRGGAVAVEANTGGPRMQGFLLQMTALAALLLVALGFALAGKQASESQNLHAIENSMESAIDGLDALNADEAKTESLDSSKDGSEKDKADVGEQE